MTIQNAALSTLPQAIYTSTGQTVVTLMYFCNNSTDNHKINIWLVPNGDTVRANTQVYNNYIITGTDTLVADKEKIILDNGDAIYANANANVSVYTTIGWIAL
jgi:hypothetical protein